MNARTVKTLDDYVDVIGVVPDRVVAEAAGMTDTTVRRYRHARGIPSCSIGRLTGEDRATAPAIRKRAEPLRWTSAQAALLGTMPDARLAVVLGTSRAVVQYARTSRCIPPFSRGVPPIHGDGSEWAHLLGTMGDVALGKLAGVSRVTAWRWRDARGIPPYRLWSRTGPHARKVVRAWTRLGLWALEHDEVFLTTTVADALGMSWRAAERKCKACVKRGELVCVTEPAPGIPGEWVTA